MTRMMWSHIETIYRGQSLTGTVVTVDEDAMSTVLKHAGKEVFDTEWWVETLHSVLEHWGLRHKQWLDPATQVMRVHYRFASELFAPRVVNTTGPIGSAAGKPMNSGPLTTRILNSGKMDGEKREA